MLTLLLLPFELIAGILLDLLPVAGLHKRYYILGSAMMGTAASVVLSAAPMTPVGRRSVRRGAALPYFARVGHGCVVAEQRDEGV